MTEQKPVVIELGAEDAPKPQVAAPVPELDLPAPAMEMATRIAAARPSWIARLFWASVASLVLFIAGVATWDFVFSLLERNPTLGYVALALTTLVSGFLLVLALRELASLARLNRIDGLRADAERVRASGSLEDVRGFQTRITRLYAKRADLRWGLGVLKDRGDDVADVQTRLAHIETALMGPLDAAALAKIEAASRQVATATALVPLALADVVVALTANVRMIRQIAQIYGGRAGTLGAWRLTKAVAAHLVATGAVAVGDDLIGSLAGGGLLSKVSRRFGEGVINGALTARVGIAAMEVCRPMPFDAVKKPRVTGVVKRALTGLFS